MDPLSIECQQCGSKAGLDCTTYKGGRKAPCRRRKEDAGQVGKKTNKAAKRRSAGAKAERQAAPLLAWAGLVDGKSKNVGDKPA